MKIPVWIAALFLLSGCMAPGSRIAKNNLDLTVMKNGKPAVGYELDVKLPKWYGQGALDPDFDSKEFFSKKWKTDRDGRINIPIDAVHHIDFLLVPIPISVTKIKKPMLFIKLKDLKSCDLVLWYLEDEKFFIAMKYANGNIDGIKYPDDVSGSFTKTEKGWDIKATIHRIDRICEN